MAGSVSSQGSVRSKSSVRSFASLRSSHRRSGGDKRTDDGRRPAARAPPPPLAATTIVTAAAVDDDTKTTKLRHVDDDGRSVASSKSFFSKTSSKMFPSRSKKKRNRLTKKSKHALGIERSPMEEAVTAESVVTTASSVSRGSRMMGTSGCYGNADGVVDDEENASLALSKTSASSSRRGGGGGADASRREKARISKMEKIQQLAAQNSVLKTQQRQLNGQVDALADQIAELRKTSALSVSTLEIQLHEARSALKEAKRRNRSAVDRDEEGRLAAVRSLKEAAEKQESRIVHLKADLERRRQQSREKDAAAEKLGTELRSLKKAKVRLQKEVESTQSEIAGLQRELTAALDRSEEMEEERFSHERERRALQNRINDYQRRLDRRRDLEKRNADLFASEKKLVVDPPTDDKDRDELQNRLAERIERITELELALDELKETAAEERRNAEETTERLRKETEESVKESARKLAAWETVSDKLKEERDEEAKRARDARLDNEGLNERIGWLMEAGDRDRKDLETAKEDLRKSRTEVEELKEKERESASEREREDKVVALEREEEEEKRKALERELEALKKQEEQRLLESQQEEERRLLESQQKPVVEPEETTAKDSAVPPDTAALVKEKEALQKQVEMLQTLAKKAMDNVQNLEREKVEATKRAETLERKLKSPPVTSSMTSSVHQNHNDDESSVGSSVSILNSFRFDDDEIFENASRKSRVGGGRPGIGALFRRSGVDDDASQVSTTNNNNNANANAEDRIVSVSEEEVAYKEEKINTLQYAKKRHEQTIGALVKEVLELRKAQKASQLQIDNLRNEREAFELKVAVLEKEFSVTAAAADDKTTSAYADVAARYAALGSTVDAETRAMFESRAHEKKVDRLERIISEDKRTISALRKETADTKAATERESARLNETIDGLRKENISFFQKLKRAERGGSTTRAANDDPATIPEEGSRNGEDDDDDDHDDDLEDASDDARKLRTKLAAREEKMMALKRYNEMMERTVTSLRSELVETRTSLRNETNDRRAESDRLKEELDARQLKIDALETRFNEVNDRDRSKEVADADDDDAAAPDAARVEDLSKRLDQSRAEIRLLETKLANRKAASEKTVESLRRDAAKSVEERSSLEHDMMRQLARLDEAKHRVDALTEELRRTKDRLESVEEEKTLMEEDFTRRLEDRDADVARLEKTVLKLRDRNLNQHETLLKRANRRKKKKKDSSSSRRTKDETDDDDEPFNILRRMTVDDDNNNDNHDDNGTATEMSELDYATSDHESVAGGRRTTTPTPTTTKRVEGNETKTTPAVETETETIPTTASAEE